MTFKSVEDWDYADIEKLKENKKSEGLNLEYKSAELFKSGELKPKEEKKLIQEACSFANNDGGYIILGVKGTKDEPSIPQELEGIDKEKVNSLTIQQLIEDNIEPRISIQFSDPIPKKENKEKIFLVIFVPEGVDKPCMNKRERRYYMRYDTKSEPMLEREIANMYRERFSSSEEIENYIKKYMSSYKEKIENIKIPRETKIYGHIFILPPKVNRERIDSQKLKELEKSNNPLKVRIANIANRLPSQPRYNNFGIEWIEEYADEFSTIQVHDNGLIHFAGIFGPSPRMNNRRIFQMKSFGEFIILTLKYSIAVYKIISFSGTIDIKLYVKELKDTYIETEDGIKLNPSNNSEVESRFTTNTHELEYDFNSITRELLNKISRTFDISNFYDFNDMGDLLT